MKRKLIALNVLLVLALGVIVWQAQVRLREFRAMRRNTLNAKVSPIPAPPLTPAPRPDPVTAAKYADVATKDLFSKDRNPAVVIDPPKIEVPKKMPPLPVVYGVLGLPSGTRAIMAENPNAASKPVRAGDTIGEFKIAALDPQNVTFEWDDKRISRKIDELIDRSTESTPGGGPAAAQASAPARAVSQPQNNAPAVSAGPGKEIAGQSERPCVQGDNSPAGTVVDGYKKNFAPSPFGPIGCMWVKVQ